MAGELTYDGQTLEQFSKAPPRCSVCCSALQPSGICSNLMCPDADRDLRRAEGLDTRTEHCDG
jgi:hypothetical protein